MKLIYVLCLAIGSWMMGSCGGPQAVGRQGMEIFPVQEATVLSETMASRMGLTALQKSNVYTTLLSYYTQKKALYDQLKNNAISQAALNEADTKLNLEKNQALKSIMDNDAQLSALGQYFGVK